MKTLIFYFLMLGLVWIAYTVTPFNKENFELGMLTGVSIASILVILVKS